MSYREYDFSYVKYLCDEWLVKNEKRYQDKLQKYESLSKSAKWIELPPCKDTPELRRILALKSLVESDGALNRIVHLSAEDCYILNNA